MSCAAAKLKLDAASRRDVMCTCMSIVDMRQLPRKLSNYFRVVLEIGRIYVASPRHRAGISAFIRISVAMKASWIKPLAVAMTPSDRPARARCCGEVVFWGRDQVHCR